MISKMIEPRGCPSLPAILKYLTKLATDRDFFGTVTLKFQGPNGVKYVTTERGQKPEELPHA